jgi:hypothetical protein
LYVSVPNSISDTPIISSGGGATGSGGQCQAYQTSGSLVDISGNPRVVLYGGGNRLSKGGYLSAQLSTTSNKAFILTRGGGGNYYWYGNPGAAIGLFTDNTGSQSSFIAGAGGSGAYSYFYYPYYCWNYPYYCWYYYYYSWYYPYYYWYYYYYSWYYPYYYWYWYYNVYSYLYLGIGGNGGGWKGGDPSFRDNRGSNNVDIYNSCSGGTVYSGGYWFNNDYYAGVGFYGGTLGYCVGGGGGASSISAFYNIPTKTYTVPGSSFTISGGNDLPDSNPIAYVCR